MRDVDVAALMAMIEQLDDVVRELALISTGASRGPARGAVPAPLQQASLLRTMEESRTPLFAAKEEVARQAAEAWGARVARIDVAVDLPTSAAGRVTAFLAALERADTADSALLLPPTPPEAAAFRRWFFGQVAGQLGDGPLAGP